MNSAWKQARDLLCIRLDGLGGVLTVTPALRALKQANASRSITLLAPHHGAIGARFVPEIDDVIACGEGGGLSEDAVALLLQGRRFDAAVIFAGPGQEAMAAARACRDAGIPLRLARGPADAGDALTDRLPDEGTPDGHDVRRHLALVAHVGAIAEDEHLSFHVRASASSRARIKLDEGGVDLSRPYIVVHPGPGEACEPDALAQAAARLSDVLECQVVVTGDAPDRQVAEAVRRGAGDRARSLAGSLTLEELGAVLELGSLLVSNVPDVSLLAAALGTPVVDLAAADFPTRAPWMVAHRVVAPAGTPRAISVDELVASTCDLWLDIHWRTAA